MKTYFTLIPFFFLNVLFSQQQLEGTIKDIASERGLFGASIILLDQDGKQTATGVSTDETGYFVLTNIPLGRQSFEIRYIGYKPKVLHEIVISAGKIPKVHLYLEQDLDALEEVVVRGVDAKSKTGMLNKMAVNSAQLFDVETIERFSGGRRDLSRLARSYAGVLNTDDSRNDILVRGNSPTGVLWRLEGIPIPNPNHFAVSGTTGGPVSAININLLETSNFLRGAFPAEYGDVTSGVFDVFFRNGNHDQTEITGQIHATGGLELEIEGPLNKEKQSSYLVSYRYAVTSIDIIPIGTNAVPNYQDLSFKLNLGKLWGGQLEVFGVGGISDIDFLSTELDEDDLFSNPNEDLFNISKLGIIGLNHKIFISDNTYLKNTLAYTISRNEVLQNNYINQNGNRIKFKALDLVDQTQGYQFSSVLNTKVNAKLSMRSGLLINKSSTLSKIQNRDNLAPSDTRDENNDGLPDFLLTADYDDTYEKIQVYTQAKYRFSEKWSLHFGLNSQYFSLNKNQSFEPRGGLTFKPVDQHQLSFSFGKQTQVQPLPILFHTSFQPNNGSYLANNLELDNSKSFHYILSHQWNFLPNWSLKTEAYFQELKDVAVEAFPSTYSVLNEGANFRFSRKGDLVNEGKGKNKGVEMTLERYFNRNYYLLFSSSLFDSKYTPSDGIERNTAFNNKYVYNILGGKEFDFQIKKSSALLTFFVNTKLTGAGGAHYTPIDLNATINNNGVEVYDELNAFNSQYSDYFRWDLKFGLRANSKRRKITQEWSIDLLNVTNKKNLFLRRFNEVNSQINDVNQLGIFIDILYKIQF